MPKQLMALGVMVALVLLNGCGAAMTNLTGFESSKSAYLRCLEQNSDDPSKCESLRQAYEADLRALRNTSQGLTRGSVSPRD